jgi:hypothetical protein
MATATTTAAVTVVAAAMAIATMIEDTVAVMIADTMIAEVTIPEKVLLLPPDVSYEWRTMFCFSAVP